MKVRLSRVQSRALAVALLALVVVLVAQAAVLPAWRAYQRNEAAIEQHREHIARFRRAAADVDQLQARLEALQSQRQSARYTLSGESPTLAAAALQERVKAVVEGRGGELISTRVLPAQNEGGFSRVTVNVRMAVTVEVLQQVLYELESGTPYLMLDNIMVLSRGALARRQSDSAQDDLDVRFDLSGFMRAAGNGDASGQG